MYVIKCRTYKEPAPTANFNALDVAKFICALLVVAIHIAPFGNGELNEVLNFWTKQYVARLAVPFFFMASGYLLFRKTDEENFSLEPAKKYALRMLKLYILWTLVYFPFDIYHHTLGNFSPRTMAFFFKQTVLCGSYVHLWYLPAVIFAECLAACLLYKKLKIKTIVLIAFLFYLIGFWVQCNFLGSELLESIAPNCCQFIKGCYDTFIGTHRNGLFFGFLFVSAGGYLAYNSICFNKRTALIGFAVSMVLLFVEVWVVSYFKIATEQDMYICLFPSVFFLFCWVMQIKLSDNSIYLLLRKMSALIFFIHLFVAHRIISLSLLMGINGLSDTYLLFVLTLLISIIVSLAIIKLSEFQRLKWLKHFIG